MAHDFKKFPELTNNQLNFYYFDSPHKQITESFIARVVKITDGDTIRVKWNERDFDFPVRLAKIQAPELKEEGGLESAKFLKDEILGAEVIVNVNSTNRVGRWGRLIGDVIHEGRSMSDESMDRGLSKNFYREEGGEIPPIEFWEVKI